MGIVSGLVIFGLGILSFGFYYRIFTDVINEFIVQYVIHNEYYVMSSAIWGWLPWIFIIVGIIALISAGILYHSTKVEIYE